MIKILFICHGNICRSPLAESVMTYLVNRQGLASHFQIFSAATSREEIGNTPHHGTVSILRQHGIPLIPHRAVQMTKQDYETYDYLIAMDSWNVRNILRIIGADTRGKISKLLDYTDRGGDIADPWYTGNFDETYQDVWEGCTAFLDYLMKQHMHP